MASKINNAAVETLEESRTYSFLRLGTKLPS
jgi:hypothetical protein